MSRGKTMIAVFAAGLLVAAVSTQAGAAQRTRSDPSFHANPNRRALPPVEVGGESCATPPTQIASTPFNDADNTCGHLNDLTTYTGTCTLPFPYGGEDLIYRVDVGAGNSLTFNADIAGSTGDLALFLIGTCGDGTSCVANSSDLIGPGVGPEVIGPVSEPAGDYYLYVDSYYDAGTPGSCGTYNLTVTGTLPVELLDFSVS